jgi:hypothetical protein
MAGEENRHDKAHSATTAEKEVLYMIAQIKDIPVNSLDGIRMIKEDLKKDTESAHVKKRSAGKKSF